MCSTLSHLTVRWLCLNNVTSHNQCDIEYLPLAGMSGFVILPFSYPTKVKELFCNPKVMKWVLKNPRSFFLEDGFTINGANFRHCFFCKSDVNGHNVVSLL